MEDIDEATASESAARVPLPFAGPGVRVVHARGRQAVLAHAAMLEVLAERCGQPGAMHGLDYLVEHEYTARKTPHLILLSRDDGGEQPCGAALFFEHRIGRWGTGFFATGDSFGVRTVIGPEPLRASLAARACAALLERRPGMALASFKEEDAGLPRRWPAAMSCHWATQTRLVQDHLPLAGTVDATLARLGKRTRTHLRYYRRKLEDAVPCEFVTDVGLLIDPADSALLERLNLSSLEPLSQGIFDLQYRSTALSPDGFVSGLRSDDGEWLALVGGWRQGGTTWVQWQMNSAAYPSLSVGTAARLFLIEQEVGRGTRRLAFHGGTSHPMRHAFPPERVVDLMVRRGVLAAVLSRTFPVLHRLLPQLASRGNFLADALRSPGFCWTSGKPAQGDPQIIG